MVLRFSHVSRFSYFFDPVSILFSRHVIFHAALRPVSECGCHRYNNCHSSYGWSTSQACQYTFQFSMYLFCSWLSLKLHDDHLLAYSLVMVGIEILSLVWDLSVVDLQLFGHYKFAVYAHGNGEFFIVLFWKDGIWEWNQFCHVTLCVVVESWPYLDACILEHAKVNSWSLPIYELAVAKAQVRLEVSDTDTIKAVDVCFFTRSGFCTPCTAGLVLPGAALEVGWV